MKSGAVCPQVRHSNVYNSIWLQLEEEYQRKIAAVNERERALTESMKSEYECVQRETYNQRQQLLNQTEQLRLRENELREERENTAR